VVMVRVIDGTLRKGQKVRFMATGRDYELTELGVFNPHPIAAEELGPGEVGFLAANIKSVVDTKIGDTVTDAVHPATVALPGFKEVKPMVFAGIFPTDSAQYEDLRDALTKLHMNDAAFVFEPDTSEALGFGFRCGFLGLLHMEIIQERLEREYNLDLITTAPSVVYHCYLNDGTMRHREPGAPAPAEPHRAHRRAHLPDDHPRPGELRGRGARALPGAARRAEVHPVREADRVIISYDMPLSEVLFDFHDA
jgi:GTP-binding protein LepA